MSSGRRFWPVIAWLIPVLPVWGYYRGNWESLLYPFGAAALFGILGILYLLTSLVLSTRIRWIDRIYGHDRVMRFHSIMAVAAILLIVIHRQLKLRDGPIKTPGTLIGTITLLALAASAAIAVMFLMKSPFHRLPFLERIRLGLTSGALADYSRLKILHILLSTAAWGAAIHVLMASTTRENLDRMLFMAAYALITLVLYVRYKFIRPYRLARQVLTVTEVIRPGKDVTELRFSGHIPDYLPGQYGYWRLNSRAVGREEHPFNISTSPGAVEIGFSAKDLGNYTGGLKNVRPGDTAILDGPYGTFTLPSNQKVPVLFIAGGIGITPFRSMASHMAETRSLRPATLIWAVKRRADLIYAGELLTLTRRIPDFRYKSVIEIQEIVNLDVTLADYESGYVTGGLISGLCPDLVSSGTMVYVCCPDAMRISVLKILKILGVPGNRIRIQRF